MIDKKVFMHEFQYDFLPIVGSISVERLIREVRLPTSCE